MSSEQTWHVRCLQGRCPLPGVFFVITAALAHGQVVSFDASRQDFPEVTGWTRVPFCTPERVFEDGVLTVTVEIGECGPPPGGDSDAYTRQIPGLVDTSDAFFAEARLITTGPRSEFPGAAPAKFILASLGPVEYDLTIGADQVKFFRDALLPIPFFDLDDRTEHTFRLETRGAALYELYIDAVLVDAGMPEAAYPQFFPFVGWRSNVYMVDSTTRWRFVRLGRIALDASADFDSDGQVDDFDVFYIDECIVRSADGEPAHPSCSWADEDGDNAVTCDDWEIIAETLWTGPGDPPQLAACVVVEAIPAVSQWGVGILALLTLTGGSLIFDNARRCPASVGSE